MKEPAVPHDLRYEPASHVRAWNGLPIRLTGAALLVACALLTFLLRALVTTLPHHEPTPLEMLMSLAMVLAGMGGALMAAEGPALFDTNDRPPRWRRD